MGGWGRETSRSLNWEKSVKLPTCTHRGTNMHTYVYAHTMLKSLKTIHALIVVALRIELASVTVIKEVFSSF